MNFNKILLLLLGIILISNIIINGLLLKEIYSNNVNIIGSKRIMISEKEAAKYLNISEESFKKILDKQDLERKNLNAYDTYKFVPYIKINNDRHFTKEQLDKWVDYNIVNNISLN